MKLQHEPAAYHVAQRAVGLPPVPGLTQLRGKGATAGSEIGSNQLADEDYIGVSDRATSVFQHHFHAPQRSSTDCGTQVLSVDFFFFFLHLCISTTPHR